MARRGVTLIEFVVVLAILAIVLALFIPAVQRVREAARETVCKNNVAQINLALSQYGEVAGIPPANPNGLIAGWTIEILPFLEQQNLQDSMPIGRPTTELEESFFKQPSILRCPTQSVLRGRQADEIDDAHYAIVVGEDRKTYIVGDAPLSKSCPWVASPEFSSVAQIQQDGPHNGGYFYGLGFQHGVRFFDAGR